MAPDVLIHGDTHRSPALRHELPLGIIDAFSYFELNGRRVAVIPSMEADRVREVASGVEVIDPYELGIDELIGRGMRWDELEPELCLRAAERLGARRLVVPGELPVSVADRLRAAGIEVIPDEREFIRRRRAKNAAEVAGVRRAQAAADAGMAAAAAWSLVHGLAQLLLDGHFPERPKSFVAEVIGAVRFAAAQRSA